MTLDEILASIFPGGHRVIRESGLLTGGGRLDGHGWLDVLGISGAKELGVEDACYLAGRIIEVMQRGDKAPLLLLIDSSSQRMSRRDELLGLNEYLAHLAKALILASTAGHRVIALLYGWSAAGAFIATALAADTLVALPGAHPAVMDLPSMAKVTKLPIKALEEKGRLTPVFAPGLDNLARTGAIIETWSPKLSLASQLVALLEKPLAAGSRDSLGAQRGGRKKAADIAARVTGTAQANG
jgi:malonate decarboxylase gamma subunit